MTTIRIYTVATGVHFGAYAVIKVGELSHETDVRPFDCGNQARWDAYDAGLSRGWFIEVTTLDTPADARVRKAAKAAGLQVLLDTKVVVPSDAPGASTYDWAGLFEAKLNG